MGLHVVHGAVLQCDFGMAPSALAVLPQNRTMVNEVNAANIGDHLPMANIQPFGMCMCPANPQVAAATAAALGVLTPQPCLPVTPAPWTTGSPTVALSELPLLNDSSMLMCTWGGMISITSPGQAGKMVP
jgi:hypothetical protein